LFEFLFKYSRDDYARSELVFTADWPPWLLILVAVIAVLGVSIMLWRRQTRATIWQLLSVWVLQVAMLAIVAVVLLQPALKTERLRPGENSVALAVDASESMAYGIARKRMEIATEALADGVSDVSDDISFLYYAFADAVEQPDGPGPILPDGKATAIADSLVEIIEGARSQSLAAVVLASDGIETAGTISIEQLARIAALGVPVHTIGVGRDQIPEDIELAQIVAPGNALPGSTITARVAIRHDQEGEARIRVYDGDELLATENVQLPAHATMTTALIDIDLQNAGYHRLQFSIDPGWDEPERRNNVRSTLVNVEEQQFRVLYFEGEPRWEYKFMRRAIDLEGDIRLASLLRVSPNKFYRQGLESAEQLQDGFPTTRDELFAYDALIIGSIEAASFSEAQLDLIRAFVSERGGSLLMLAGPNGLGNGGWGQSAVADLMPTRLPSSSTDSFTRVKAPVRLTPQGANSEMLRLAESTEESRDIWAAIPHVADYQSTGELKPAATTLLDVVTETGAQPLLVKQPFGRGNVYVLATGGTWRWQMSSPLEDQSHETFWRQFARAMVASAPAGISLTASGDHDDTEIRLRAEFRDDAYRPIEDIRVSAVASHEDGESFNVSLLPSADDAGVFTADVPLSNSGTWYFEAIAGRDGEAVHVARTSAYSESGRAEYFNIRRNSALLQRVSDVTGGQHFEPDDLDGLADLLRYSNAGITEQILRPVWDAPAVFLLLLLVKFAEWLLRRRWRTI
jgi:uncharacterized membrane protein